MWWESIGRRCTPRSDARSRRAPGARRRFAIGRCSRGLQIADLDAGGAAIGRVLLDLPAVIPARAVVAFFLANGIRGRERLPPLRHGAVTTPKGGDAEPTKGDARILAAQVNHGYPGIRGPARRSSFGPPPFSLTAPFSLQAKNCKSRAISVIVTPGKHT